jgi:hypothetical protein
VGTQSQRGRQGPTSYRRIGTIIGGMLWEWYTVELIYLGIWQSN